jgi:outer membrane protein insertion porin family
MASLPGVQRLLCRAGFALCLAIVVCAPAQLTGQQLPSGAAVPESSIGGFNVLAEAAAPDGAIPAVANLQEPVVDVRIEGNKQLTREKLLAYVRTRPGRPFDQTTIEEDVRRLNRSRMCVNVKPFTQRVQGGWLVVFQVDERPTLQDVLLIGPNKIRPSKLRTEIKLKAGDPADPFAVEEARRKIEEYYHRQGFTKARVTIFEGDRVTDTRAVFVVNEGPKQKVLFTRFVGNTIATDSRLLTQIQSKPPILYLFKGEVNRETIEEDVLRLTAYYRNLGYMQAKVGRELDYNESQDWLVLTFVIYEGPRSKVRNITIIGNSKIPTEELAADLKLKREEWLSLPKMTSDAMRVQEKYGRVGYVFADVKPEVRYLEDPNYVDLVYTLTEGDRYRVGRIDVQIKGDNPHTRLTTVLNQLALRPGDIVDTRKLRDSERKLRASGLFLVDPMSGSVPKIVFTPPETDEDVQMADRPRYRGQSPDYDRMPAGASRERTLDVTLRRERPASDGSWELDPNPAWQPPLSDPTSSYGTAFEGVGQFAASYVDSLDCCVRLQVAPTQEPSPRFITNAVRSDSGAPAAASVYTRAARHEVHSSPYGQAQPQELTVRGQYSTELSPVDRSQSRSLLPWFRQPAPAPTTLPPPNAMSAPAQQPVYATPGPTANYPGGSYPAPSDPAGAYGAQPVIPEPSLMPATGAPAAAPGYYGPTAAPNYGPATGYGEAPMLDPPAGSAFGAVGIFGSPYNSAQEGLRDLPLIIQTEETQTGKLMLGVGVNSDAGLVGSIILDEQNFDWRRPPTSWNDVATGRAWRGGGQRFRMEAVPGTEVQRYMFSFQEPYFFNSDVSLGLSAFYYDRLYQQWKEQRVGARISLGYHFTRRLSGSLSFRPESINIRDVIDPNLPDFQRVLGTSDLYGFGGTLAHDTRDSPFLATEGHLVEFSFEQVLGRFTYAHGELDVRQYFLLWERPDTSGRHVLSFTGRLGITGAGTPIYDRYYAGGFTTIRGFAFRGASPRSNNGIAVGGEAMVLASVEYLFPITADDMIRGVVFVDSGAVQPSIDNWTDKYRIAPGVGLRISIPAMGPAPIAFDFAFPITTQAGDEKQVFSFFLGVLR